MIHYWTLRPSQNAKQFKNSVHEQKREYVHIMTKTRSSDGESIH